MIRLPCSYLKEFGVLIILFVCSFSSYSQTLNNWELKKDKKGIKVFTRKKDSLKIREFKAVMTANTSLKKAIETILDGDRLKEWNYRTSESKTVQIISNTQRIIWMRNNMPWPIKDHDHITKAKLQYINKNEAKIVLGPDTTKTVQTIKNVIRIVDFSGYWHLKKTDKKVEISQQLYVDLSSNIPHWIVNPLLVDGPYNSFKKLREKLEENQALD